jgi:Peptidase M1 N-terminal domain
MIKKYCFRVLATTHFEATYARAAFPCFDEPHFKARFKLSIFRDRFHISLTNMPVANTEDAGFYMGTGLVRPFVCFCVIEAIVDNFAAERRL